MSQGTERPGLYVMVFIAMLNSCDANDNARRANEALKKIAEAAQPAQAPMRADR